MESQKYMHLCDTFYKKILLIFEFPPFLLPLTRGNRPNPTLIFISVISIPLMGNMFINVPHPLINY